MGGPSLLLFVQEWDQIFLNEFVQGFLGMLVENSWIFVLSKPEYDVEILPPSDLLDSLFVVHLLFHNNAEFVQLRT